jgi:glutathione S-transferase
MILYGAPVSPFVRKVLVAAAIKGVAVELVPVGMGDQNPDFLAASPFRKMPALTDGDFSVPDSSAIIAYLEAKHPEPALIPAEAKARARTIWFDEFADTIFVPATGPMFFNRIVAPKFMKQDGDMAAADKAEKEGLPPILDYLESVIPPSGYLVGDALTLADISVACPFVNAAHCGVVPDAGKYPKITAFLANMYAKPGFAEWIPRERKMLGLI